MSGTAIDYRDPTDELCLDRLRRLAGLFRADLPEGSTTVSAPMAASTDSRAASEPFYGRIDRQWTR